MLNLSFYLLTLHPIDQKKDLKPITDNKNT